MSKERNSYPYQIHVHEMKHVFFLQADVHFY